MHTTFGDAWTVCEIVAARLNVVGAERTLAPSNLLLAWGVINRDYQKTSEKLIVDRRRIPGTKD